MEVLGEFAKYAFLGLTRKDRFFKRSVLKYVSIKKPVLTQSGVKSRVCVNQPDRLWTEPSVTKMKNGVLMENEGTKRRNEKTE